MPGWKSWASGVLVDAANFQSLLQNQVVAAFTNAAARTASGWSPHNGAMSYLQDKKRLEVYDGAWAGLLPSGLVLPYGGATAPGGWLLCNGQAVSRTTYADLYTAIGTAYGAGDGSTTFNLPDLRGRVPVGRDAAQTEFDVLGETGGAKNHYALMTIGSGKLYMKRAANPANWVASESGSFTAVADTSSVGGGFNIADSTGALNSLPPYQTVNYLVKT